MPSNRTPSRLLFVVSMAACVLVGASASWGYLEYRASDEQASRLESARTAQLRDLVVAAAFSKLIEKGDPIRLPPGMTLSQTESRLQDQIASLSRRSRPHIESAHLESGAQDEVQRQEQATGRPAIGRITVEVVGALLPAYFDPSDKSNLMLGMLPGLSARSCGQDLQRLGVGQASGTAHKLLTNLKQRQQDDDRVP